MRRVLVVLALCLPTIAVSVSHASADSSMITFCVNKSGGAMYSRTKCSANQTSRTWDSDGSLGERGAACVNRSSLAMTFTSATSCGSRLYLKWTVSGPETTHMSVCINKKSRLVSYSPMEVCRKGYTRLTWVRTLKEAETTTTSSPPTTAAPTTTAVATTTTTTTTTIAPVLQYTGVQFGAVDSDWAGATEFDSAGNMYVSGGTSGTMSSQALIGSGSGPSGFVTKFSAAGERLWTRQFRYGTSTGSPYIAVTSAGSVYGMFAYAPTGGTDSAGALQNFGVFNLDTNGDLAWVDTVGTDATDFLTGMVIDSSQNIYFTGYSGGDFLSPSSAPLSHLQAIVAKMHRTGLTMTFDWVTAMGDTEMDYSVAIVRLPDGNLAVTGFTNGVMPSSGGTAHPSSVAAPWAAVLSAGGSVTWTKQWTTAASCYPSAIATDPAGAIYIVGETWTDMRDVTTVLYKSDGFLRKLSASNGATTWTQMFGSAEDDGAYTLATDTSGNVYAGAYTEGTVTGVPGPWIHHPYVTKYDQAGTLAWTSEIAPSPTMDAYLWGLARNPQGGVVATGETNNDFGGPNADASHTVSDSIYWTLSATGTWGPRHA